MSGRMKYHIGSSKIHGNGVIANQNINRGEIIDVGIDYWLNFFPYVTSHFGSWINHCYNANTKLVYVNNKYYIVAQYPIKKGNEITVNYDQTPWYIAGSRPWYI